MVKPVLRGLWGINVYLLGCTYMCCKNLLPLSFSNFATNSDKFWFFMSFWDLLLHEIFFWNFLPMNIMVKPVLIGIRGINVYWGALMCCEDSVSYIFPVLWQIVTNFDFFGHFGAFSWLYLHFWTFIPINIMVKTSFERYMGHKYVLVWGSIMCCKE